MHVCTVCTCGGGVCVHCLCMCMSNAREERNKNNTADCMENGGGIGVENWGVELEWRIGGAELGGGNAWKFEWQKKIGIHCTYVYA